VTDQIGLGKRILALVLRVPALRSPDPSHEAEFSDQFGISLAKKRMDFIKIG
jgi:hypothetical protein